MENSGIFRKLDQTESPNGVLIKKKKVVCYDQSMFLKNWPIAASLQFLIKKIVKAKASKISPEGLNIVLKKTNNTDR